MNRAALYHKSKSEMAFVVYNHDVDVQQAAYKLKIRLKAAAGDLDHVWLIFGDKYDWNSTMMTEKMRLIAEDGCHDWYEVSVKPQLNRLAYAFKVEKGRESLYYTEEGFFEGSPSVDVLFQYPYIHASEVMKPLPWVESAVFYQIMPDRFCNGDYENDPSNVVDWKSLPTRQSFYGGDLAGILKHLDALEKLGITVLYLMPIFEAPSNHKYDTKNYFKIDPAFGTHEDLKSLVDACHGKGMRVVLDGVFNHVGKTFDRFREAFDAVSDADHPYRKWFYFNDPSPLQAANNILTCGYETFAYEPEMPKLRTDFPDVEDYIADVATFWIETYKIDGIRLDVANELSLECIRRLRISVNALRPDFYLLGEIWSDATAWVGPDKLDGTTDFPRFRAVDAFLLGNLTSTEFTQKLQALSMRYEEQVLNQNLCFVENHDTARLLSRVSGNKALWRLGLVLLLTSTGVPGLFYGVEDSLTGGPDPDCRRTIDWDHPDKEVRFWLSALIHLRRRKLSLRSAQTIFYDTAQPELLAYERFSGQEKTLVLIHRGHDKAVFRFNHNLENKLNLLSGNAVCKNYAHSTKITLKGISYAIFEVL